MESTEGIILDRSNSDFFDSFSSSLFFVVVWIKLKYASLKIHYKYTELWRPFRFDAFDINIWPRFSICFVLHSCGSNQLVIAHRTLILCVYVCVFRHFVERQCKVSQLPHNLIPHLKMPHKVILVLVCVCVCAFAASAAGTFPILVELMM